MATDFFSAKKIFTNLSIIAIVIILILTAYLFYRHFYFKPKAITLQNTPSSFATNVQLNITNDSGQLLYHLLSTEVDNYQNADRSTFLQPVGYLYKPHEAYWLITADQGVATNNNTIVQLTGNIHVHQDAGKTNPAVTLTTSQMTLYPQQKIAFNDVLTTVQQPGITVTSIGFHADLNKNEIKLLSQAQGTYNKQG